jgi:hypothetical protein
MVVRYWITDRIQIFMEKVMILKPNKFDMVQCDDPGSN